MERALRPLPPVLNMLISLFVACYNDTLFPETGKAVVTVLERLGHGVAGAGNPVVAHQQRLFPAERGGEAQAFLCLIGRQATFPSKRGRGFCGEVEENFFPPSSRSPSLS